MSPFVVTSPRPQRLVVSGAQVFDGTGSAPSRADVLIESGVIRAVGSDLDGDVEIPAHGMTLLPGLFDCHVHVVLESVDLLRQLDTPFGYSYYVAANNLAAMLRVGITTARDAAGADLAIKRALIDGRISGPRLHIAVQMLSQTGGHSDCRHPSGTCVPDMPSHVGIPDGIVDGVPEMRRRIRDLVRCGADVIKLATSGGVMSPNDDPHHAHFQLDELEAAIIEARAAGLDVMAHAHGVDGIRNAVEAGARSIEHGIFLNEELAEQMAARGTFLVPTLMAPRSIIEAAEQGVTIAPAMLEKARMVVERHAQAFGIALAAGVPIAMGTDAIGIPHGRNLEELQLMVDCGMGPLEALRAATSTAARLLRVDESQGTIEPGKRADLVLVDGDVSDLSNLTARVRRVYQDGELVHERMPDHRAPVAGPIEAAISSL